MSIESAKENLKMYIGTHGSLMAGYLVFSPQEQERIGELKVAYQMALKDGRDRSDFPDMEAKASDMVSFLKEGRTRSLAGIPSTRGVLCR